MGNAATRRSFFSRLSAGVTAFGVGAETAQAQASSGHAFQPATHREDDWYDTLPGRHRIFLDALSPRGAGEAIAFATNTFIANKSGYNLGDSEIAIVICLRHLATPFAYTDAMWAKYGATMAAHLKFEDPKTKRAPVINVYNTSGFDEALPNRNISLDALAKRGVHFAVCGLATRLHATNIAKARGLAVDEVLKELSGNLLSNGHLVAAGVVAVNRAQEHGYSFLYVG